MGLSRDQSISLYGTEAYTGWGETEAMYDARAKGLSGGASTSSNTFNFNFESEVDKAFNELGSYYDQLLTWAQGDLNKALARLTEDYETGKRFRLQNFELGEEAIRYAQEKFATNADEAYRSLATSHLQRGISRESAFGTPGLGIADVENQRLGQKINLGERELDLSQRELQTGFDQSNTIADISFGRQKTDLPEQFERWKIEKEEERKRNAGDIALSRAQRAYDRFEASLV